MLEGKDYNDNLSVFYYINILHILILDNCKHYPEPQFHCYNITEDFII